MTKIDAQRGRGKKRENIGVWGCLISILAGYGAAVGCFGALLGASWAFLGASWARLGRIFGALGRFWAYLGRLSGLSGASWSPRWTSSSQGGQKGCQMEVHKGVPNEATTRFPGKSGKSELDTLFIMFFFAT